MNVQALKSVLFAASAAMVFTAPAETLTWTGSDDASNGNKWFIYSTKNWKNESGAQVQWKDGNDAYFDDTTDIRTIRIASELKPSSVTVNISKDMVFTNETSNSRITSNGSFTKLGTGTLWINPAYGPSDSYQINSSTNTVHVRGGTLKGSSPNTSSLFGGQANGWQAYVYDGGTLWVAERNALERGTADAILKSNVGITVYTNGVLSFKNGGLDNQNINVVRTLDLLGGTMITPDIGNHSSGFLRVCERFSFGENPTKTPYVFNPIDPFPGVASGKQNRLLLGTNTEFRVADITGDAAADVTFNNPVVAHPDWERDLGPNGFRKTGSGKMVVAAPLVNTNEAKRPGGEIAVEEGELEFKEPYALDPYTTAAVKVFPGATLTVHSNMFVNIDSESSKDETALMTNRMPRPILVNHGTLNLKGSVKHYAFGDLTLDHAVFDTSEIEGHADYGVLSLLGKITLDADEPIVFSPDTFPKAKANGDGKATWTRILLSAQNTEFNVAEITGDDKADFTISCLLKDQRSRPNSRWYPSGLIKTGPGQMQLLYSSNDFTGDVEVREGVLAVGPTENTVSSGGTTYLGSFRTEGRRVIASGTGTVWLPDRNELTYGYTLGPITNDTTQVDSKGNRLYPYTYFGADGNGTLKLTEHEHFDKLEFSNGGKLRGHGINGGYGIFTVFRKFIVSGSVASAADAFTDGGEYLDLTDKFENDVTCTSILVNGEPEVEFEIADTTGDAAADATFYRSIAIGYVYRSAIRANPPTCGEHKFGFRKTGAGTMRLAAIQKPTGPTKTSAGSNVWPLNGTLTVAAGELKVDCDQGDSELVDVAAGAYLSGTGTVNNVVLAAGAGLKVPAQQEKPLAVKGDFTLGANPVVDINLPAGATVEDVKAKILTVTGTITGAENLKNATVRVNGEPTDKIRLTCSGNTLKCGFAKGLMLMVR